MLSYFSMFILAAFILPASHAQVQNVTIFEPTHIAPLEGVSLAGEVIGVGTDGTTFVVSYVTEPTTLVSTVTIGTISGSTVGVEELPFTETVVQDASHVSLTQTGGLSLETFKVGVQCGLPQSSGANATCTIVESIAEFNTTILATGTDIGSLEALTVPVSTVSTATVVSTSSLQSGTTSSAIVVSSTSVTAFSICAVVVSLLTLLI